MLYPPPPPPPAEPRLLFGPAFNTSDVDPNFTTVTNPIF